MQFIHFFIKKNMMIFFLGILLIFFSGAANIILIKIIGKCLEGDLLYFSGKHYVLIAALVFPFFFGVAAQWILEGVGYKFVYQLRKHLLAQVLQAEPENFQRIEKSKLLNAFSKDIPEILKAVAFTPYMLYGVALIIMGVAYMLLLSWKIALVVIGLLIISVVGSNKLIAYCQALIFRERELHNGLVDSYTNIIDGHNELALNEHRACAIFKNIISGDALESKNILSRVGRIISISSQFMGVMPLMLIGVVCWINYYWQIGSSVLVVSFALTLLFIRQPLGNLVHQIEVVIHAKVALTNLTLLNFIAPQEFNPAEALSLEWKTLILKDIRYKYPENDNFNFGPVSLTINRGELLFLVGSNGAGKSTLIKLLSGLLIPIQGDIYVDDEIISACNRRQYRAMFSAVLSENFLFNSLFNNDIDSKNKKYVESLITQLELQHIGFSGSEKFNTKNLSTGQKKRLAMIISLMENRSIMILDEWAADQDPKFRRYFYEHILPDLKSQGITLIVISHDDRYFHLADRVMTIESGLF